MGVQTNIQQSNQASISVAIQGYPGAFHDIAARCYFKDTRIELVPADSFEELVEILSGEDKSPVGLMAIENTIYGSLMHNYALLTRAHMNITGEVFLRISQNLLTVHGTRLENLKEVHSHPIAIEQCREFFNLHPHIRLIENPDTALSARMVSEKSDPAIGAIGSQLAADIYGLQILCEGIETEKKNYTRFLVLNHNNSSTVKDFDKVSISFTLAHEVGSLHGVLKQLILHKANMSKIQSTPILGKPWEYRFFIDFVTKDPGQLELLIPALQAVTHDLLILGTYKSGNHYEDTTIS